MTVGGKRLGGAIGCGQLVPALLEQRSDARQHLPVEEAETAIPGLSDAACRLVF